MVDTVRLVVLLVQRAGRYTAGIDGAEDAALLAEHQSDRAVEDHHPRVKVMRMRRTMHVRFDAAFADFAALAAPGSGLAEASMLGDGGAVAKRPRALPNPRSSARNAA